MNRVDGDTDQVTAHWQRLAKLERARTFCDKLNEMLKADPDAIYALVEHRVACNNKIATDTSAVTFISPNMPNQLGMLGVLNGLLDGWRLVGHYTDSDTLTHFTLIELRDNDGGPAIQSEHGSDVRATLPEFEGARQDHG